MLSDNLSKRYFNQKINFICPLPFALAGTELTSEAVALLTGAPDGSTVTLELKYSGGDSSMPASSAVLTVKHEFFARDAIYEISQTSTGYSWVAIDYVVLKPQYTNKGLGIRMFAQQAFMADRLGINQIVLCAVGDGPNGIYNGSYTWARYGFLPHMDNKQAEEFIRRFPGVADLTELMSTEHGRGRWRQDCFTLPMYFEPHDDTCWSTFLSYLVEKGVTYA